jgi:hypothetical protein
MNMLRTRVVLGLALVTAALSFATAGYKARPWSPKPPDQYAARLTSEGITIGVEPLFKDSLAAQAFDKKDMVTRGIMPLGLAIFNDNDFAVEVEGASIELVNGDGHIHTVLPGEVARRVFQKGGKSWVPNPLPRQSGEKTDEDALGDLEHKFLGLKLIGPHSKAVGFLYLHIPANDVAGYLSDSRLYVPDVRRQDTGAKMIFFEIDLKPAVDAARAK